tara:strand:- start:141 stop:290 length:150 start_codon:yes stop_codon:yes gene_type:complete
VVQRAQLAETLRVRVRALAALAGELRGEVVAVTLAVLAVQLLQKKQVQP